MREIDDLPNVGATERKVQSPYTIIIYQQVRRLLLECVFNQV